MKILIAGFEGEDNSAKILLDEIQQENNNDILYLKNDFEMSGKQIQQKLLQNYDYVLIFGQKPNTKNIYLENNATLNGIKLITDYYYGDLKKELENNDYKVVSSCNAGNYLCNNVFFRALSFKQTNNLKTKIAFIHIPTIDNIEDIKQLSRATLNYIKTLTDIFNIALLQLIPTNSIESNMLKGIEYCRKAKEMGADIAVFPEMWSTGYEMLFEGDLKDQDNIPKEKIDKWNSKAIENDNGFIIQYINLAKELEMAIAITYLEKTEQKPKNTVIIIDKSGNIILKYSKVHTVDSKMEAYTEPGTEFKTCELDYGKGKVKLGTMICFDRDFPESARILMLQGSELILVPNACYMSKIRLEQLKVRAYENMVGIVTVNYANHSGKSSAYSPIVRNISKYELDSELLVMNNEEEIKVVQYNMSEIREYRNRETLGDAYRKPYAYEQLIENNVQEPFIRKDARR